MTPYVPPRSGPDILFADESIVVVVKPPGLLSVPGRGPEKTECVLSRLHKQFPDILTVHRLDMATSGVMVFARTKDAQRNLSRQFEKRLCEKVYIADVWGLPSPDTGEVDLPLVTDWPNRPRQKVDHEHGKPSQTGFKTLGRNEHGARMELIPKTGRSHQLRVHMKEIGHPILGDQLYAHDAAKTAARRLCLHAYSLKIAHPISEECLEFSAACPF